MRAPLNTMAPVAIREPPSITQPVRCTCGPTSTSSPIRVTWPGTPRMTACSMITQSLPISTGPPSAVTTAPNSTRLCGPTVTSPASTAVGAMYADSDACGIFNRCSTNTAPRPTTAGGAGYSSALTFSTPKLRSAEPSSQRRRAHHAPAGRSARGACRGRPGPAPPRPRLRREPGGRTARWNTSSSRGRVATADPDRCAGGTSMRMSRPVARATRAAATVFTLPLLATACTAVAPGGQPGARPARAPLTGAHPCPGLPGFTCSYLAVPLDRSGKIPGTLRLQVAAGDNSRARLGTLLFLTGGPGQPGVPFVRPVAHELTPAISAYRLVMIDQRGTGGDSLNCPGLQRQMGESDTLPPTAQAVRSCAE